MVDLTRGMRPQLNLNALVIFTMQLPLSAHSHSHYYDHILYEIQIQYVSMRVVYVHLITNFCCRLLSETLTSTSSSSSSAFRIRIHVFQSDFSPYYYFNMRYTSKQTYVHTHHVCISIHTYVHRYMCKYL